MTGTELPVTSGYALVFVADPHRPESPVHHVANVLRGLEYTYALTPAPCLTVDLGDSNKWEFRDILLAQSWFRGVYKKVLGNHDGNVPYLAPSGTTPAEPFSDCIAAMPEIFADGQEWWSYDVRTLDDKATHCRAIGMQTNRPYTMDDGFEAYPEVNPPGLWDEPNPDHTGLLDPLSPQRLFLANAIATAPAGSWIIPCGHRGIYTARHADPRKNATELRALYAEMEAAGVSLFPTGDVHTSCVVRLPGGKATYLAGQGGYFLREPQPEVVPPGSLLWVTDYTGPQSGRAHVAYLEFLGDSVALKIIETSDAEPEPRIVHTETLIRNGGVAGGLEGE